MINIDTFINVDIVSIINIPVIIIMTSSSLLKTIDPEFP